MDKYMKEIERKTTVVITPEQPKKIPGFFWVHSNGMVQEYGLPDVEIRQVNGVIVKDAQHLINRLNAYRIEKKKGNSNQVLIGQTIDFETGFPIGIEEGEDWNRIPMLRLTSRIETIECNHRKKDPDPDLKP